jgi:hypothetical protein
LRFSHFSRNLYWRGASEKCGARESLAEGCRDRRSGSLARAVKRDAPAVNHWVILTRECENSKGRNAGCGGNPGGCTRYPRHQLPKRRKAMPGGKSPNPCRTAGFAHAFRIFSARQTR